MSLTPHGPGFAFLDAFEITVPDKHGLGKKHLDPTLPFFADHFPGQPLMPGVLLIECAAQTAGALWASIQAESAPKHFILAQVVQFKLQHPVFPNETVITDVLLDHIFGTLAQFTVTLTVNQREVARGKIVLSQPA